MDKLKENNIEPALIVKLVLVLVILLTVAFVSGVVIGKNGRRNVDRTSSDEEGINEKLSNCIFNSDELRGKYLKLRDAAREKGLLDENDAVNAKVICRSVETFPETSHKGEPQPAETKQAEKPVETSPETSPQEKPEQAEPKTAEKPVETKPAEKTVETSPETSPKEKTKPAKTFQETSLQEKQPKPAESKKPDKNKTIDEILAEKDAAPKPVKTSPETSPQKNDGKKCRFSIQIFAANTKEQADAAVKKLKSLKPRVVSGENNGKKWYKLRSGCFDSREAAEAELPKVRKSEKSAYIVSE